jgi:hypothetical protein
MRRSTVLRLSPLLVFPALTTSIELGQKCLAMTNTLAYLEKCTSRPLVANVKNILTITSMVQIG